MAAFSDIFIGGSPVENSFESLDYIYTPAPDFDAAVRFYTSTLAGELRWRIHDGGARVAAVRLAGAGPAVLLASHLATHHTILIFRVRDIEVVRRRLVNDGWTDVGEPFEIPPGPCLVFRDPGGQRLAIYERVRPGVEETFDGRFDEQQPRNTRGSSLLFRVFRVFRDFRRSEGTKRAVPQNEVALLRQD